MVSGMSQRKALNDTALGTANWLAYWGKRLKAEMKKQNIDRYPKRERLAKPGLFRSKFGPDDNKETITFERGEIRRLLDEMAELVRELRRFEKPLGKARDSDD
jgi:hypothetical protein